MDVSTSSSAVSSTHVEAMKKAMQVQEQAILKALESAQEQSKQLSSAQKTGMGISLDIKS
ncbi:hypothetical protein KKG72_04845 [bacterium]|nr:hypothetical protein [bacterium]MBU1995476.1 hypothetical protein [bacterium]